MALRCTSLTFPKDKGKHSLTTLTPTEQAPLLLPGPPFLHLRNGSTALSRHRSLSSHLSFPGWNSDSSEGLLLWG